jgi:hypothetical protein
MTESSIGWSTADTEAPDSQRWTCRVPMNARDQAAAEQHRRERDDLLQSLWSILSPELYEKLVSCTIPPEVHGGCSEYQDRVLEGLALHFGPLAPAIRAVARHVIEDHDGSWPRECGLDFRLNDDLPWI